MQGAKLAHTLSADTHSAADRFLASEDPRASGSIAADHATYNTVVEHFAASEDTGASSSSAAAQQCTLNGGLQEAHAEQRKAADGERYTKQECCEWYGQNKGTECHVATLCITYWTSPTAVFCSY